jgi:hypothetical protein
VTTIRAIAAPRLEVLLAALLASIAFFVTPFTPEPKQPRHAARRHQPCLRVSGARTAKPRHRAARQGRNLDAFRVAAGALATVAVLIAWYGFDLASFVGAGA